MVGGKVLLKAAVMERAADSGSRDSIQSWIAAFAYPCRTPLESVVVPRYKRYEALAELCKVEKPNRVKWGLPCSHSHVVRDGR